MTLLVFIRFHIGMKHSPNCCMPKKNMVVKLNPVPGLPPRAKNQASQGTIVETQGTPLASQTSATGFVVSGVDEVRIRSALFDWISSRATCDARSGLDCVRSEEHTSELQSP